MKNSKIKAPRGWNELQLGWLIASTDDDVMNILFENPTETEIALFRISALCGVSIDDVSKAGISTLKRLANELAWLSKKPLVANEIKPVKSVRVNGQLLGMLDPFSRDSIDKFITIDKIKQEEDLLVRIQNGESSAMLRLLSLCCHFLGSPYDSSEEAISERERLLRKITVTEAVGLCNFFLTRWTQYKTSLLPFGRNHLY